MAEYASNLIQALRSVSAPQAASDNPGFSYYDLPAPAPVSANWRTNATSRKYGNALDPRILALRTDPGMDIPPIRSPFSATRPSGGGGNAYLPDGRSSGSSSRWSEPSPWSQMSEQDQAKWYRDNPLMGDIAGTALDLFSYTLPGQVLDYFNPEGMYRAQAVTRGFSPTEGWNQTNNFSNDLAALNAQAQAAAAPAPAPAPVDTMSYYYSPTDYYSGSYSPSYSDSDSGGWGGYSGWSSSEGGGF